jgi:hypothetical protein
MYFALDFILHLLVRRVEDATLLSQRMMVLAGKKWNSRTVHKEIRWGNNLRAGIRNGSVQIRDESHQRAQSLSCAAR